MPDFDFDAFNHDTPVGENEESEVEAVNEEVVTAVAEAPVDEVEVPVQNNGADEEVDKW